MLLNPVSVSPLPSFRTSVSVRQKLLQLKPSTDIFAGLGGSGVGVLSTCVSDIDIFVIAPADRLEYITSVLRCDRFVDVEGRSRDWLTAIAPDIAQFSINISGAYPPFDFYDLRFLARAATCERWTTVDVIEQDLCTIEQGLRLAVMQWASAEYVNCYQDLYGLFCGGRFDEVRYRGGELAQKACLIALASRTLLDPSPKWAIRMALEQSDALLKEPVRQIVHTLFGSLGLCNRSIAESLLQLSRCIVGTAWLRGSTDIARVEDPPMKRQNTGIDLAWCPMGLPNFLTVFNVLTNSVHCCNSHFLEHFLAEAAPI
jgi:hypothetical protein